MSTAPPRARVRVMTFSVVSAAWELTLERIMNRAITASPSVYTCPRFREVCTRPATSALIIWTPLGAQNRKAATRRVLSSSMGMRSLAAGSRDTRISGSAVLYSFCRASPRAFAAVSAAAKSFTATRATASRGMALSLAPPETAMSRRSVAFMSSDSARPIRMLALARPLWISSPEWPPIRPSRVSLQTAPS